MSHQESRKNGDIKGVWSEINNAPKERAAPLTRITNLVNIFTRLAEEFFMMHKNVVKKLRFQK